MCRYAVCRYTGTPPPCWANFLCSFIFTLAGVSLAAYMGGDLSPREGLEAGIGRGLWNGQGRGTAKGV